MSIDSLLASFASPPASNRPQPLWVWNGTVTRTWITRSLEELFEQGCGGVFVHPRPGLITEYLSEEWFSLWRFAADECRRLGMECHIYDENSFPAGFAGGHVPATNPLTTATTVRGQLHTAGFHPPGEELLAVFRVPNGQPPVRIERHEVDEAMKSGHGVFTLAQHRETGTLWQGGFPYVDLTLPDTTRTFLQVTHDAYARHVGEYFGNTCKYAFSDEPMLHPRGGLVYTPHLAAEFRREHGYDLDSRLADFLQPTDAGRKARFDYQMTVQRLFEANFAAAMNTACRALGLEFTGHFMEHEWPSPSSHPSAMSLLRHMPVPGNDLLGFQFDSSKPPEHNALWQLNLAELRSVAAQTGAARVLTETCGGGGYNYTLADFKACEDFALVGGVTLVNPHLVHQTLTGARRYDWAQTISPHAPWYDAYREQADHVARVQTALLAGKHVSRVLVLMPTTSAWLDFLPNSLRLPGYVDPLPAIRDCQTSLVQSLASAALDFDLGDELILRDLGRVEARRLRVGEAGYDVVVVPEAMRNVLASTLGLLRAFAHAGGTVLTLADGYEFVAGTRPAGGTGRWSELGESVRTVSRAQLLREIRRTCPPVVVPDGDALPPGVLHLAKTTPDGDVVHFFANPCKRPADTTVRIRGATLLELHTTTGGCTQAASVADGDFRQYRLRLSPGDHRLLVSSAAAMPSAHAESEAEPGREVAVRGVQTRRTEDNLLVLDYCDLESAGGTQARSVPCITADRLLWRDHGWGQNPWRWAIQYRRTYLDSTFPEPSGFELRYVFHVEQGVDLASLKLAVERPFALRLSLNSKPIDTASGERFFDEEMFAYAVGRHARVGDNVLTLRAAAMHPLAEVTPVMLLGDFSVRTGVAGFVVSAAKRLETGALLPQGLPFYNRSVHYTFEFDLADDAVLRIDPGEWQGSVLGARIDDGPALWFTRAGQRRRWPGRVGRGRHVLTLDLRGHFQNQMGPWHAEGLPIPWVWENAPSPQPPGEKYRLRDWGLLGRPGVWIVG